MSALSRPPTPSGEDDGGMSSERTIGPVDAVIFGLVPAVVFAILMAVLLGDTGAADLDLQLMVPAEVGPGETIPARALLLDQVGGDRVPVPVQRTVVVRLTDEAGTEVTRTALHGSASLGMEGELPGPEPADVRAAGGSFWVHARVELDAERRASVRAPLRVSDRPGVARVRGRLALPLQQYEAGVVIAEDGQIPPSALELRVRGGACVPELPCDLLIHVGRPAAATRLVGSGAVTVLGEEGGGETDGIVALRVITHGPEASVDVEALRAGVLVARRTVRLPIALAGLRAGLDRVLLSPQGAPSLVVTRQLVQEQAAVLLDAFHEERWRVAGSLDATASAGPTSWPSPPLSPGLWCIQARTDPFGVDRVVLRLGGGAIVGRRRLGVVGGAPRAGRLPRRGR